MYRGKADNRIKNKFHYKIQEKKALNSFKNIDNQMVYAMELKV